MAGASEQFLIPKCTCYSEHLINVSHQQVMKEFCWYWTEVVKLPRSTSSETDCVAIFQGFLFPPLIAERQKMNFFFAPALPVEKSAEKQTKCDELSVVRHQSRCWTFQWVCYFGEQIIHRTAVITVAVSALQECVSILYIHLSCKHSLMLCQK